MVPAWFANWTAARAVAAAALVIASSFASASETAFFSLNRFQLRWIRERYPRAYSRIRTLLGRPSRLLVLILGLNELVNITISNLVTTSFSGVFGEGPGATLATGAMSMAFTMPLVLLFGEITPKVIAAKANRVIAMVNSRVLIGLYRGFFPLLWAVDLAISMVLRKLKATGRDQLTKAMSVLSEEDFMILMEEGHREGTVDPSERKLIKNVFEFDDSVVSEVMTPISQAFSVAASARVAEALPELRAQKYSRVPVYQRSRRDIVGILYLKDLLALRGRSDLGELDVKSLMTRAMFVGPNMRLSVLFRQFKDTRTHMAIVGDDEQALGVVTMEDVLESIFGEIADERDVR